MNRECFKYLLILIFLILSESLSGQWRDYQFTKLGPEEGLQTTINKFTQDSVGYIYCAADQGLIRYDGHNFEVFAHDPNDSSSIGAGEVIEIYLDDTGMIWLGTKVSGLNRFDPTSMVFTEFPLPDEPYRTLPGISSIIEDEEKNIWVGGYHFRLFKFDKQNETFETFSPSWIDPVSHGGRLGIISILQDRSNPDLLWLSVVDLAHPDLEFGIFGMVSFNRKTHVFEYHPAAGNIQYQDLDGSIYSTYWGNIITKYTPKSQDFQVYDLPYSTRTTDLLKMDNYSLVSSSNGIWKFDHNGNFELIEKTKDFGIINDIFVDHTKNLWFGGDKGAYIVSQQNKHIRFLSLKNFGMENRIYPGRLAFDPDQKIIYLAHTSSPDPAQRQRIYRVPIDGTNSPDFITTNFDIRGVAVDKDQNIWAAGNGLLSILDKKTGNLRPRKIPGLDSIPWIWNLRSDNNGWIGGIGIRDFIWFHPQKNIGFSINQSALTKTEGRGWLANNFDGFTFSNDGYAYLFSSELFKLNLSTGEVQQLHYDHSINPHNEDLRQVVQDHNGDLWISSAILTAQYTIMGDTLIMKKSFTVKQGMVSPYVHELYIDYRNRVWAFTGNGINCIDPNLDEIRYFGSREGLPDIYIDPRQVISLSDGSIATVNSNGLILFHPDSLWNSISPTQVPIVMKNIRVNGEIIDGEFNSKNILELKKGYRGIDIEFQGLHFPTDYKLEYCYRINNLIEEWISIGENKFVTLPALKPGRYKFEVKAGGISNNSPINSLEIIVKRPFYSQAWFLVALCVALLFGFWKIYKYRISIIRLKEQENTNHNKKIAELELKALRAQMNPHFMFNSLNSIKNYILISKPQQAAQYLSSFAHLIRMILQHSREKYITLKEELEALQLYIELEKLRLDDNFDFYCEIDEINTDQYIVPPLLLQPFIENAIWHGLMAKEGNRYLWLKLSKMNGDLKCIIEDNGVGRKASQARKKDGIDKHKSLGIGIIKDRIDILNRTETHDISVEIVDIVDDSGAAQGTKVVVIIPQKLSDDSQN